MLSSGQRIGRYTLTECLGSGGFGAVWAASDRAGREVALKILHKQLADPVPFAKGPTVTERFLHEARLIGKLHHPGLVRIHEVLEDSKENLVAYAMDRLHGRDLGKLVGDLDLELLLLLFADVADTLTYLHDHEVIHRDVKPQNIFATSSGAPFDGGCRVKLLDFGAAKEANATARLTATGTGVMIGTIRSMAPESFKSSRVTPAVDQWGLGVTMFHCLTGSPPFDAHSLMELIRQIEEDDVPKIVLSPQYGGGEAPLMIQSIVERCLAKRAEDRFRSMQDVAIALRADFADETIRDVTVPTNLVGQNLTSHDRLAELLSRHLDTKPTPARSPLVPEAVTDPSGNPQSVAASVDDHDDTIGLLDPPDDTTKSAVPSDVGFEQDDTLKGANVRVEERGVAGAERRPLMRAAVVLFYVVALILAVCLGWILRGL